MNVSTMIPSRWLPSQPCLLCGAAGRDAVCPDCRLALPWRRRRGCLVCDALAAPGQRCGACLAAPPAFDATVAAFHYAFPVDRLVQGFKFEARLSLSGWFARSLEDVLAMNATADLVVPVPLGRRRLAARGFNPAGLVARELAKSAGLDCRDDVLSRAKETVPQSGLDRDARRRNVRGAFACGASLAGMRVALVDDVMTTGATLSAAALALKRAGAVHVSAWVLARAERPDWDNAREPAPPPAGVE